jgi:hypothetical protein
LLPLIFGQTFIDGWYPLILPSTLEPPPSAEPLTPSVAAREKSHTNDSAAATTSTSAPAEVFVSFTLAQSLFTPDEIEDVRVATVAIQSLHALPPNWLDDASRIEEVDEQNRRQRLEEEAAAAAHREKGSRNKGTTTTTGTRAVPSTPKAVLPGPVSSPTNASATANAGNETPQPGESKTRPASRAVGATLPSGGSTAGGNSGGTQVTPRGGGAGGRSTKADKKKDEERKTRDRIPRPLYKLLVAWPANDDTIPTPELPVILPPPEPPAPAVTSSPTPTPPVAASDEKRTTKGGRVGALSPSPLPPPAAVTPTPSVVTTAFPPAPHAVPVPTGAKGSTGKGGGGGGGTGDGGPSTTGSTTFDLVPPNRVLGRPPLVAVVVVVGVAVAVLLSLASLLLASRSRRNSFSFSNFSFFSFSRCFSRSDTDFLMGRPLLSNFSLVSSSGGGNNNDGLTIAGHN